MCFEDADDETEIHCDTHTGFNPPRVRDGPIFFFVIHVVSCVIEDADYGNGNHFDLSPRFESR